MEFSRNTIDMSVIENVLQCILYVFPKFGIKANSQLIANPPLPSIVNWKSYNTEFLLSLINWNCFTKDIWSTLSLKRLLIDASFRLIWVCQLRFRLQWPCLQNTKKALFLKKSKEKSIKAPYFRKNALLYCNKIVIIEFKGTTSIEPFLRFFLFPIQKKTYSYSETTVFWPWNAYFQLHGHNIN